MIRPKSSGRRPRAASLLLAVALCSAGCASRLGASEAEALIAALALTPGSRAADVGAGNGRWSEVLAEAIGDSGHLWATEVEQDKVDRIERRLEGAGFDNFTTALGTQTDLGLPEDCCDAILLRLVYHHFSEPAVMRAELRRALRPGGRLLVVETEPHENWSELPGVPDRGGHGIPVEVLVEELVGDGFRVVERLGEWFERDDYAVVFAQTAASSAGDS